MRRISLVLTFVLATIAVSARAAKQPELQYVSVANTRLLSKPAAFSSTLATLDAGEAVEVISQSGSYVQVKARGQTGWIGARSLLTERPKIGYSGKKSTDASAEEVAAATKGFNTEVEAEYKRNNPKLDYEQLDRLEARTTVRDPGKDLEKFRKEGQIGEFSPAAASSASGEPGSGAPK